MGLTVNVNGLSLAHKGSGGTTAATVPDVCKTPTPGGPVPIPYPNISLSSDLAKGSTTVKADGGNMIAIKGSEFSKSTGDEPGTAGEVKSGTNMKEAKWLSYSMDVKIEGKNACRLSDKMTCNHGNTVSMFGEMQAPLLPERAVLCAVICKCDKAPVMSRSGRRGKQRCVDLALEALDQTTGGLSTMKPEVPYNMTTQPPSPLPNKFWQRTVRQVIPNYEPGTNMVRIPDVVVVNNPTMPPIQSNIRAVVEIKFPPDRPSPGQIPDYQRIAGNAPVEVLTPQECGCQDPQPEPEPFKLPKLDPFGVFLAVAAVVLIFTPIPGDEVAVGGLAAARLGLAFVP